MDLNKKQLKGLKALAHSLDPVVLIGKAGVTDSIIQEVETALNAHELIKLKFIEHKEDKESLGSQIVQKTKSTLVAYTGNCLILFKQNKITEKRKINLNALKYS